MTTIPSPSTSAPETTTERAKPFSRGEIAELSQAWRWFLGQPRVGASFARRLPLSLPATKEINQHPLYGGALSRQFWRTNNYRLTRAGRWFLGLTFALGIFGGMSLDIQTYIPFLYACGVWLVCLLALPLAKPRVRLRAIHGSRAAAGTTLPVTLEITQDSVRIPGLDLTVLAHKLPLDIDAEQENGVLIGSLAPGETVRVRAGLICPRRGVFKVKGWRVESDFPFGVTNAYRAFEESQSVTVYPQYRPLTRLEVPTGRRYQPGGITMASSVGESFEYFGNREFREGDNIRDIDWRATARMAGTPILREWREEYFLRVAVILDTYIPVPTSPIIHSMPTLGALIIPQSRRARAVYEQRGNDFERAVSISAAVSDYLAGQEYVVDLFGAGPELFRLQSGRGLATNEQVLDILANTQTTATDTLSTLLPQLAEDLPQLTSVICVFLDWDDSRRAFAESLRSQGAGVKIIVVRASPPALNPAEDPVFEHQVVVIDADAFAAGVESL
ncbi:MAG: DUF58 domain-containing protein [Cytophagales bacterium]|nr:DUF58 domain-containing protein [Armatimonadota bacterium]